MSVTFLETAMKLEDAWHKNDFAMMLAIHNPEIGDEYFFQGLIFAAVEAGVLTPLPRQFNYYSNPKERNFIFRPGDLRRWALSKNLNIGELVEQKIKNDETQQPPRPSTEERNKLYKQEADRIYSQAEKKPTKKILAQQVFDYLKATDPKFITGADNKLLSVGTIERNMGNHK